MVDAHQQKVYLAYVLPFYVYTNPVDGMCR
jgi:hypothetical protein